MTGKNNDSETLNFATCFVGLIGQLGSQRAQNSSQRTQSAINQHITPYVQRTCVMYVVQWNSVIE